MIERKKIVMVIEIKSGDMSAFDCRGKDQKCLGYHKLILDKKGTDCHRNVLIVNPIDVTQMDISVRVLM